MLNDNVNAILDEIRALKSEANGFLVNDYRTGYLSALSALEGFIAGLPAVDIPKWISVKERLPEYGERVMFLTKERRLICVGPYRGEGAHGAQYFYNGNRIETANWWMPLPEPPKEET